MNDPQMIRVLCAFVVGILLSITGSLTQALFQTPMATPATLGVDGVMILALMFLYMLKFLYPNLPIELCAFVFLLIFLFMIKFTFPKKINLREGNTDAKKFIILGLSLNLLVGAVFYFLDFLFSSMQIEFPSYLWFGHFKWSQLSYLKMLSLVLIVSYIRLYKKRKILAGFSLGFEQLALYGLKVLNLRLELLLMIVSLTSISIIYFGSFNLLALLFPMLLKSIFFFKQRLDREILIGSLFSGLFLCFLDFLVYQFPVAGAEIPVGMLAAILGSCVLCYMVIFENYLKQKLGKKNTPR